MEGISTTTASEQQQLPIELQEVLSIYQQLVTNSELLAQGQAYLENAINTRPHFAALSLKLFVSKEYTNIQSRIYIGALLKNMLRECWQTNTSLATQKKDIRETLLHGLIMNVGDLRIIETIALMLTEVMGFDGVELWANPLKEIVEWIPSGDASIVDTGLEFFCTIFSRVGEKCRIDKLSPNSFCLSPIIPKLLLSLFNIFTKHELTDNQREKVLVLIYMAVSSIAYADGTDNALVAACFDETFKSWMGMFIAALQTNAKTHITMKRYILKILIVLFRDFTYYTRDSIIQRILPIWKFLNSTLPLYVWTCVYGIPIALLDANIVPTQDPAAIIAAQASQSNRNPANGGPVDESLDSRYLDEDEDFCSEIEGLALNAIELVATLVTKHALHMLIKQAVFPIINALAHFVLLTREQEKLWVEEPNQFVSDDDDEANMKSIRNLVYNLIFQLIERFGDQTTQALMIVAEKFMMNYDEAHTSAVIQSFYDKLSEKEFKLGGGGSAAGSSGSNASNSNEFNKEKLMEFVRTSNFDCSLPEQAWKKRETGMLLLGSFSDDIIDFQYKHTSSFDITSLISNLITDIQSANSTPILVAKSLWCVSRFSEIIVSKSPQLFLPLFQVAMSCLAKTHAFPVRLTAVKAIGTFSVKLKQIESSLPQRDSWRSYGVDDAAILTEIFDVLAYVNADTVHIILDTLLHLNKLSPAYLQATATLGARPILQVFTLQHSDHMINRIVLDLITLLAEQALSFEFLFQSAFYAFILDSFNLILQQISENTSLAQIKPLDLSLMASIFDITAIFVKNCKNISENATKDNLMNLYPPLLRILVSNEEPSIQQHASLCLKEYLSIAHKFILQTGLAKDTLQVIMKLLQVPANSQFENSSTYSGNLTMVAFHNLLNGSADPEILKQVVYKIFRSRLVTTVQGLVLVWARMIIKDPLESVNFLCSFSVENRFALKALIDKWLLQQPVFRGKNTKNATFLALTKLFLLKDKRLENLIVIAFNPSHTNVANDVSAPLKIFSTLIRGLDNEITSNQREEEMDFDIQQAMKYNDGEDDEDDELDGEINEGDDGPREDKIDVGMGVIQDEEVDDVQRRFNVGENKAGGGLGQFETNSTNYITDGFVYGNDEGDEGDESTEDDLIYLNDPQIIGANAADILKSFFTELVKNDPKYFSECLKNLLKEDVELLQKHITFKASEESLAYN